jgi:hypothetical protein
MDHHQNAASSILLSDSLFPPRKLVKDDDRKEDPLATQVWRLYTKAKDTLPNGSRLENLTWRMMAMTLKKKEGNQRSNSPPVPDDTVCMLSSSAPPSSTMTHLKEHQAKNVLVHGSTRVSSPPSEKVICLSAYITLSLLSIQFFRLHSCRMSVIIV